MLPPEAHKGAWVLKDVGAAPALLGCQGCSDLGICGGLHLRNESAMLTCMDHCQCNDSKTCDLVCPRRPEVFARRIHEVRGLDFENIPRKESGILLPPLPRVVPILEGRVSKRHPVALEYAAVPLTRALIGRGSKTRAKTAEELKLDHGVNPRRGWIATGIEDDRFVERTWGLAQPREVFKAMKAAGVIFATSPNYSLYLDAPRHDNLHAMKRIAWMWYAMNEAGIPTALHVNGRTDHDFERWASFIAARPEVTSIAFEFLTGAKQDIDAERYMARLTALRASVGRPLLLAVRGAAEHAHRLEQVFEQVVWLDASPYFRAVHRQEPIFGDDGVLRYCARRARREEPIGALFKQIFVASQRRYQVFNARVIPSPQQIFDFEQSESPPHVSTNNASTQRDLFA